ncbi:MAG: aminoacyl-tRNA hydrolase [Elusimicrobia bacterium]|nr:aminoacyl-tRNA hydrolase [Elusimicrobiota bacterium]
MAIRLIVGLGNPGIRYRQTRHNFGFQVLDAYALRENLDWRAWRQMGEVAQSLRSDKLYLAKPETFMNRSGEMVRAFMAAKNISPEAALIVYDDFALPLGQIRIRPRGSAGGQLGMTSILEHLRTQDIPRVRLGTGPVPGGEDPADFVLQKFAKKDLPLVRGVIERACEGLDAILERGIVGAMSVYNGLSLEGR